MLQSLAIQVVEYGLPLAWPRALYLPAPNLQAVRLGPALWRGFPTQSDVSSSSATAVEYWPDNFVFTAEFFKPLDRFPHLRHLSIHTSSVSFRSTPSLIVPTPALETLIISLRPRRLQYMQIPTLRHLDVHIYTNEDCQWIISFLTRSACVLTHLRLRMMPTHARWVDCLAFVPTVVNLALTCSEDQYPLLHRADLLPRLQTLRLDSNATIEVYPAFLSVLRARPNLLSAELRLLHSAAEDVSVASDEVLAALAARSVDGTTVKLSTHVYRKNRHEYEEDAEDYNVFDPRECLPYVFASFEPRL